MIGILIGLIVSIITFTIYGKDQKAVNQHKKKKQEEQLKIAEEEKKRQQQINRVKNDPQIQKKRLEQTKKFKEKLFQGLTQKERIDFQKMIDQKKKEGKTDQQIIRSAANQAGLLMLFLFAIIIVLVIGFAVLYGVDLSIWVDSVKKLLTMIYPKMGTEINQDQGFGISQSDL